MSSVRLKLLNWFNYNFKLNVNLIFANIWKPLDNQQPALVVFISKNDFKKFDDLKKVSFITTTN